MDQFEQYRNGEIAWQIRKFPENLEDSGCLGVIEYGQQFEFIVKRVFFLRNLNSNAIRGQHAHKNLKQIIVCLNGSFTICLDNGLKKDSLQMKADNNCLLLDGKVWREMKDFSNHAVIMVLCDREYRYDEVVRDFSVFKERLIGVNNGL